MMMKNGLRFISVGLLLLYGYIFSKLLLFQTVFHFGSTTDTKDTITTKSLHQVETHPCQATTSSIDKLSNVVAMTNEKHWDHYQQPAANETTFSQDMLDETVSSHPCGEIKCFFQRKQSMQQQQQQPSTGFLIAKYRELNYNQAYMAWELAMNMTSFSDLYDQDHSYIHPPFQYASKNDIDEDEDDDEGDDNDDDETATATTGSSNNQPMSFREWLMNQNITRHVGNTSFPIPEYHKYHSYLIHEVKAVNNLSNEPILYFGCRSNYLIRGGWNNVEQNFIVPILEGGKRGCYNVQQIHDTLQDQTLKLKKMLQNTTQNFHCMYRDFQTFLVGKTGRFIHIDLDRCFYNKRFLYISKQEEDICQERIDDLMSYILQALKTGKIPSDKPDYVKTMSQSIK